MQKIISIVLPTYNRVSYLAETLGHFKEQLERNIELVEMIVCNNASTDNTDSMLCDYNNSNSFFKYLNYEEHVAIGLSIKRAISNAEGKYVLLWGDDDLPSPLMIDTLLFYINKYPDAGLIHFNRLFGYSSDSKSLSSLRIQKINYVCGSIKYNELSEFISTYFLDTSFLSSILFLRDGWIKGSEIDPSKHYGYEFLSPIYYGLKEKAFVYISYPLLIQRIPRDRSWINRSPYYRFIGIPNLLNDIQKWGIIISAKKLWMQEANSLMSFLVVISQTSLNKKFYRPLIQEINSHQPTLFRKLIVFFFIYIFPSKLYIIIRKIFVAKKQRNKWPK